MEIIIKENTSVSIDLNELFNQTDWTLNGSSAIHKSCNTDSMYLLNYIIKPNTKYTITYEISNLTSGGVQLSVGGVTFANDTTAGGKTVEVTTLNSNPVRFLSDGNLTISNFSIVAEIKAPETTSENTITWSEKINRWVSFRSYSPESGFSMFTDLFTYYNGRLYRHSVENEDRNVFYGNEYNSIIKFPVSSSMIKNYGSVAIHSNKLLITTEDGIQTQLGDVSNLIEEDFVEKEGIFYAEFKRAKPDIIEGDRLKGRYIIQELIDIDGQTPLQLFKVHTKSTQSTPNE